MVPVAWDTPPKIVGSFALLLAALETAADSSGVPQSSDAIQQMALTAMLAHD